jgi:hypothetical protein
MTEEEIANLVKAYGSSSGKPAERSTLQKVGDTARDVGKTIETSLTKGVVGTPGMPADMVRLGQLARDYMRSTNIGGPSQGTFAEVRAREDAKREAEQSAPFKPSNLQEWGSQRFAESADELSGGAVIREPTTPAGRAVALPAEMAGGALAGGVAGAARTGARGLVGPMIRQGVVPGAAITAAQQSGLVENPVALGAIGIAAGGAAEMGKGGSASGALRSRAGGATEAQVAEAERMFQAAQARNLPLSRANALDIVTGGRTDASGLQRVVEGGGSEPMREFYADAPQRIQRAGGQALDEIAPVSPQPSTIGPRAAEAMDTHIAGTEQAINAHTRPAYEAIQDTQLTSNEFTRLLQDPLFMREHQRILESPEYNHLTQGVQPDSIQAVDLTRRILAQRQERLSNPMTEAYDPTAATGYGASIDPAQETARAASRRAVMTGPNNPNPLEAVQTAQAQAREALVDPLRQGPEGRIAAARTTEGAQDALFQQNPTEGSHVEIGRTVGSLSRQDPELAAELVRNYLGTHFAAAQRSGPSGATYNSGPAFWKQVMGNPEQAAGITAALNALPNGRARAEAFHDVMRIFQAMGQRQHIGSRTSFNAEDLANLKEGGLSEGAAKMALGVGVKWPQKVMDAVERYRLGQNVDDLARLFTDPARGAEFARIVRSPPDSAHRTMQIMRLLGTQQLGTVGAPASAAVRAEEERQRKSAGGR